MDSEVFEVFIWAGIAAVAVYFLYSVLGKRQGFYDKEKWSSAHRRFDSTEPSSQPGQSNAEQTAIHMDEQAENLHKTERVIYDKIKKIEPHFNLDEFLKGAEVAFFMILESFAKGDLERLQSLFSNEIFEELKKDIEERESAEETLETQVLKIHKMEIRKLELLQTRVRITLEIESEQFHILKDASGTIIEGSENQTETLKDLFVFERDLQDHNPNWTVIRMDK